MLAWLFRYDESKFYTTKNVTNTATQKIYTVVVTFTYYNDDDILKFLYLFFIKCKNHGLFSSYVNQFIEMEMCNSNTLTEHSLIGLFLGLDNPNRWFTVSSTAFIDAIQELPETQRPAILFAIKIFVEGLFHKDYLINLFTTKENNINKTPGRAWLKLRLENIADYTKICYPAYCTKCQTECPYLGDIFNPICSSHSRKVDNTIKVVKRCNCDNNFNIIVKGFCYVPLLDVSS